jgi:hypothetical protein
MDKMGLNISRGNMYEFITHTWNTIKGKCPHDCGYCYVKRWGKLKPLRFDVKELKTDLGGDNFIFVGSSCDMFAENIPNEWIINTLDYCQRFANDYFFQSKNPFAFNSRGFVFPGRSSFCTTIETNRFYKKIMGNTPEPHERAFYLPDNSYITIEPIMDFDLDDFVNLLKIAKPKQVNIGADSGNNNLPEPSKEKVLELINELQKFTIIHNKTNLKRILNG